MFMTNLSSETCYNKTEDRGKPNQHTRLLDLNINVINELANFTVKGAKIWTKSKLGKYFYVFKLTQNHRLSSMPEVCCLLEINLYFRSS